MSACKTCPHGRAVPARDGGDIAACHACAREAIASARAECARVTAERDEWHRISLLGEKAVGLARDGRDAAEAECARLREALRELASHALALARGAEIHNWPPGFKMRSDLIAECRAILDGLARSPEVRP